MRGLQGLLSVVLLCCTLYSVSARPTVREIRSKSEFDRVINHHALTGLPVIVDYYSDSCGPCRQIAPTYKKIAKQYEGKAVFIKVNVNTARDAAENVRSMPTFRFFSGGKKKHEFSGADEGSLRRYTESLSKKAEKKVLPIREAKNKGEFTKVLRDASTALPVLVAFVEKGNDDCVTVYPAFKALATEHSGKVVFVKVYIESNTKTKDYAKVEKAPTFQIYVASKLQKEYIGTDGEELKANLEVVLAEVAAKEDKPKKSKSSSSSSKSSSSSTPPPPAKYTPPSPTRPQRREPRRLLSPFPEKVIIIGAGPAGLSAATYAARAGLQPVLVAPDFGGQLMGTKEVENYPGVVGDHAFGETLLDLMRVQAEMFDTQFESTMVTHVELDTRPFVVHTNHTAMDDEGNPIEVDNTIEAHSLIIATGANSRWLGVPGEALYRAHGVSTCATCDGFLYKNMPTMVVGGGDSAMEAALHLARICPSVTLVHRSASFRASHVLQELVKKNKKISIKWESEVARFEGKEDKDGLPVLTHVVVKDKNTQEETQFAVDGAFVAIGHDPNTKMFDGLLDMDDYGYLLTEGKSTKTSLEGVFAAGDVADSVYRQAVTSAGTGAMAALDAEHYLAETGLAADDEESRAAALPDFHTWNVKQLKAAMRERGLNTKTCFEKADFVEQLKAKYW